MEKKMYCFDCDKDVEIKIKNKINTYTIHNVSFKVKEKIHYCINCGKQLIDETLDEDLTNIYNEYLKLYNLSFDKFKEIRKSLNLSQELFAKALNWSKKTVVRYENRKSLPQPEYLKVYKRILNNKTEFINILQENKFLLTENDYYNILNKVKTEITAKDINVFLFLLEDNYLNVTQIMKNFFAMDFLSYKQFNKPITNFKYAHANYGPIIDKKDEYLNILIKKGYIEIINLEDKILFKPCQKYDINLLKEEELKIMNEVKNRLKNKTANELTEWSHKFKGWTETKNGKIIDYKYAKDFELNI